MLNASQFSGLTAEASQDQRADFLGSKVQEIAEVVEALRAEALKLKTAFETEF